MKKLPLPIKVPTGYQVYMTQPYANESYNEWYRSRGITAPFHNGVDLVLMKDSQVSNEKTYGCPVITPSNGWKIVKTTYESPLSSKGNGLTIESQPMVQENGDVFIYQSVLWHLSKTNEFDGIIPEHSEIGYIGNSGTVRPEPSSYCPYCGSHLHLMLFKFKLVGATYVLQNADNGVGGAIDPMELFDMSQVIVGDVDKYAEIEKDLLPLPELIEKIKKGIAKLLSTPGSSSKG